MAATKTTGRPYLGDRHVCTARVAIPVRDALDAIAAEVGTDRSTVLADLAAAVAGRPDLARHVRFEAQFLGRLDNDGGLPLAM